MEKLKQSIQAPFRALGFEIRRLRAVEPLPPDFDPEFRKIHELCRPFTMTSAERMFSVWQAVRYVVQNNLSGDFVECGVWRGGSSMVMAYTLLALGKADRDLYLYDTFSGMSAPTDSDVSHSGKSAQPKFDKQQREDHNDWCYAGIEEVRKNILATGYPSAKVHLIQGKVEETIPSQIPKTISLLRLDTDWYESTKHEMEHLYPLLAARGVLILDDYGHWLGARKAADEYFAAKGVHPLLQRIDYTGRMMLKA